MTVFSEAEVELLALIFSPDYIIPRATQVGGGCPVTGARQAYHDAKTMARSYLKSVFGRARRDGRTREEIRSDREFAVHCFRMAERVQPVEPLESRYRRLMARDAWRSRSPWVIQGFTPEVVTDAASPEEVRLAVLKAVATMLEDVPALNRAVLPPYGPDTRVWQRSTPEVLLPVQYAPDDLMTVTVDARGSRADLRGSLRRRMRQTIRARRHEYAWYGDDCLAEWLRSGFIASYAGAMVSDAGSYDVGEALPVMIPANGVPLSVAINPARHGVMRLGVAVDHRAFDADHGSAIHGELVTRTQRYLKGW